MSKLYGSLNSLWYCPLGLEWKLSFSSPVATAVHAQLLSCVWFFATPWTVECQALLSLGFFREEYWSGLPCPPPGDLPYPGIKPTSPASSALQADSLPLGHLLSFPNLLTLIKCSNLTASSFRIWNSSAGFSSSPLTLFVVMLPKAQLTSHSKVSGSEWPHHGGYLGH